MDLLHYVKPPSRTADRFFSSDKKSPPGDLMDIYSRFSGLSAMTLSRYRSAIVFHMTQVDLCRAVIDHGGWICIRGFHNEPDSGRSAAH